MTQRTMNLVGFIFCVGTAALLALMALTGIGAPPLDGGILTQTDTPEVVDLRG